MSRRSEISAGLLAFRRRQAIEYLLAHPGGPFWTRKDAGAWTIPKGRADPDVDLLSTALREFAEETGFQAKGEFLPLSPVKQKSGKTVHAFAFESDFDTDSFSSNLFELEWPPRSGERKHFPEIDRLGWFPYDTAIEKVIPYQRPFLDELNRRLAQNTACLRPGEPGTASGVDPATPPSLKGQQMDKDRIKGAMEQAKGSVKEAAGKVTGDAKLESEGKADKAAGKVRNAVGGAKDALRGE